MLPLFIVEGNEVKDPIAAMPGCYRLSLDLLRNELKAIADLGIKAVLLFVKVDDALKDNKGTEAVNPEGLMQKAIRKVKSKMRRDDYGACPAVSALLVGRLPKFICCGGGNADSGA